MTVPLRELPRLPSDPRETVDLERELDERDLPLSIVTGDVDLPLDLPVDLPVERLADRPLSKLPDLEPLVLRFGGELTLAPPLFEPPLLEPVLFEPLLFEPVLFEPPFLPPPFLAWASASSGNMNARAPRARIVTNHFRNFMLNLRVEVSVTTTITPTGPLRYPFGLSSTRINANTKVDGEPESSCNSW